LHWGKHARGAPEDDYREQILEFISRDNIRTITAGVSDILTKFCYDKTNLGSLAYAAAFGLTSIVKNLLDEGVDINQTSHKGITALMSAAEAGHTDTVRVLLAAHADLDQAHKYASTALIKAARNGHDEVFQILLDHGANIEAATVAGDTSLMRDASGGLTSKVQLIIDKAANIKAQEGLFGGGNKRRSTVIVDLAANKIIELMKADHTENLLERLLVDLSKVDGPTATCFDFLIELGADPTGIIDGKTPIHMAASYGNVDAVRSLFKHGVPPNIRDEAGNTPTHWATFRDQ
ncbi:MAG: hypothetical protein Q9198_008418, partial [Flavoplaca austrocitrina]